MVPTDELPPESPAWIPAAHEVDERDQEQELVPQQQQ